MKKLTEKEIREATPLTIATNNKKNILRQLTKQLKDLYNNNFKSLKKEIKKISGDGKIYDTHG